MGLFKNMIAADSHGYPLFFNGFSSFSPRNFPYFFMATGGQSPPGSWINIWKNFPHKPEMWGHNVIYLKYFRLQQDVEMVDSWIWMRGLQTYSKEMEINGYWELTARSEKTGYPWVPRSQEARFGVSFQAILDQRRHLREFLPPMCWGDLIDELTEMCWWQTNLKQFFLEDFPVFCGTTWTMKNQLQQI